MKRYRILCGNWIMQQPNNITPTDNFKVEQNTTQGIVHTNIRSKFKDINTSPV
jgi:hypothetical protein